MTDQRSEMRQVFIATFMKYQQKQPLEPLERQLMEVILLHPEYHDFLKEASLYYDMVNEENPFLHMSLHLAIREQLTTNRPQGITHIYQTLCLQSPDNHQVEHKMMQCLADIMLQAQQSGNMPDEKNYLNLLKHIVI